VPPQTSRMLQPYVTAQGEIGGMAIHGASETA
jgi:hypothetical protein